MSLPAGARLGPYEILSPLGAGGMGEVYRARDTRLGRDVAVKVLPEQFAMDAERVARFEREARAASALSHAHVVSVFDFGRTEKSFYIVTEIVSGGNLRDLLDGGAQPLRRALDLAVQVASGLAEAHESGIIHRDLKPENILLTKSGDAKIADFGLAKLSETGSAELSQLPTSDGLKTSDGIVMGTVAYMSPEQAGGRAVDFRSDQFAFGAILYEILTGQSPFRRSTAGETMAAVLRDEPTPVRSLQPAVPSHVAWVLDRCLAKAPSDRYASTRDLARELMQIREHLSETTAGPAAEAGAPRSGVRPRKASLLLVASGIALGAAAAALLTIRVLRPASSSARVVRFLLPPPADARFFSIFDSVNLAVSPDGSRVAFIADEPTASRGVVRSDRPTRKVWIRALSEIDAHPLAGTEGASSIFWSPDGRSLAFTSGNQLKRIDLAAGSPTVICEAPPDIGVSGTWGGGDILFASTEDGVIERVSADGGAPALLLRPDAARGEARLGWPRFLPDERSFLYVATRKDGKGELMVAKLGGSPRAAGPVSSRVEFVDPGFVVFVRDGALVAQRFDAKTERLTGPVLPVAPSVYNFYTSKWADFSASPNGTIAFASRGNLSRLTWFDRSGRVLGEVGSAGMGETISVSISRDGRNALFDRTRPDLGTFDVWMLDLERGVEMRMTSDPNTEFDPVWLPDGKHIVYSVAGEYVPRLVRREIGSGGEEPLLPPGTFQEALGATPDGRRLLFSQRARGGTFGVWLMSLAGDPAPTPVVTSRYETEVAQLSPDGRFVAFISDESGQNEVYIEALDSRGQRVRVSSSGATLLRWSRDGKEIDFTSPDRKLMAAPVNLSSSIQVGTPVALFSLPEEGWKSFDVSPDGRFLASVPKVSVGAASLTVVTNWTAELPR